MTKNQITVCITTHNRWQDCYGAVRSVLNQIGVGIELIVVDDASVHPLPADLAALIREQDVHYIRHTQNSGLAAARNSAIEAASSNWFSFCDDDDRWPRGFAKRMLEAADSAPCPIDMVLGLNEEKREPCNQLLGAYPSMKQLLLAGVTPPVAAQMYRTSMIQGVGGYDTRVRSGVDHDLWITLAAAHNPQSTIAWGAVPIVGADIERERMTTNEKRRRRGIAEALSIWKPKLSSTFGRRFYKHFRRSYLEYLDKKFLLRDMRTGHHLRSAARVLKPSLGTWIAKRLLFGRSIRRRCGAFRPYRL